MRLCGFGEPLATRTANPSAFADATELLFGPTGPAALAALQLLGPPLTGKRLQAAQRWADFVAREAVAKWRKFRGASLS
jgi:hypothetical protein